MSPAALPDLTHAIRVADLPAGKRRDVTVQPDAAARDTLAALMGIVGVEKLRFDGQLAPAGNRDWRLTGKLGATVVQSCVVTLEPVRSRIETDLHRHYVADLDSPDEIDALDDDHGDEIEPLGAVIDVGLAIQEELALALPQYPRKPGVDPQVRRFAPEGVTPVSDEDVKPFAALKALQEKMKKG